MVYGYSEGIAKPIEVEVLPPLRARTADSACLTGIGGESQKNLKEFVAVASCRTYLAGHVLNLR